jgi:hypothetical protein
VHVAWESSVAMSVYVDAVTIVNVDRTPTDPHVNKMALFRATKMKCALP